MKITELLTMKYSKRGGYCLVPEPLTWEPGVTDELAVGVTAELAVGVTDDPALMLAGVTEELAVGVTDDPAVMLPGVTDEFVTFWLTDGLTTIAAVEGGLGTIC